MQHPHRGVDGRWLFGWRQPVALAVVSIVLAGCSHFGNSMLEIAPAVFPDCHGPNIAVRVRWDARAAIRHDGGVRLFVYKPGQEPVLWLQARAKGSAETGQWASDGWTVTLVSDRGKQLATRTLQTTTCHKKSG